MVHRSNSRPHKNPPPFQVIPNKPRSFSASAGVSSRVLVARQEYLFEADPFPHHLEPHPEPNPGGDGGSDRTLCGQHQGTTTTTTATTLKRLTSTSTKRFCSLAGAACLAAWWLEVVDSRLSLPLVCGFAGGCFALLASPEQEHRERHAALEDGRSTIAHSEPHAEPQPLSMWTITQFETLGALRFDNYLRFLVTKLAVVWRAIAALHKTATNYRFTLSISDKPALSELKDVLDGRVPLLLTYDSIKPEQEEEETNQGGRSRGSSRASTTVTDDPWYRESMDLSGMDLDVSRGSFLDSESPAHIAIPRAPASNEFMALEDQEQVTEYFTIEDDGSWSESESDPSSSIFPEDEEKPTTPITSSSATNQQETEPTTERKISALRSILVPVQPLETLTRELNTHLHVAPAPKNLAPLVVPSVKPMVETTNHVDWNLAATRPEAAALLARAKTATPTTPKRRISVNVTSMKPLPRLVVKARPSTLTPPQNVQRMLDQVERMMREVHDLLAAGRDVLRSVETPEEKTLRTCKKSVSFSDDVRVIDSALDMAADEERELRSSLSYGPDEIESMSNAFFADVSLSSDA